MRPTLSTLSRFAPTAAVVVLSLWLLRSTAQWLGRNDLPDGFQNEFIHLFTLTEAYFRARDERLGAALPSLFDEYYPPLIHLSAAATFGVVGPSYAHAVLSVAPFITLLLGAATRLGYALLGWRGGIVVPTALAFSPAIFGNMRRYEPNLAVSAFTAAAISTLIVRGGLADRRAAALAGTFAALALLSDRLGGAIFITPVLCVATVQSYALLKATRAADSQARAASPTEHNSPTIPGATRAALPASIFVAGAASQLGARASLPELLVRLFWFAAPALVLAGFYYVRWFSLHFDEVWTQRQEEITAAGQHVAPFARFSLRDLLYYPLDLIDGSLGLVLSVALFAGTARWFRVRAAIERGQRRLLETWVFGALVVLTLIGKKQPYYSIPLLAGWITIAAVGLLHGTRGRTQAIGALVVLLAATHQHAALTDGEGFIPTPGRWAALSGASPFPDGFLGERYTQAAPPNDLRLHVDWMATLCEKQHLGTGRPSVLLFSEGQSAYEGQLMPTLRLQLDRREVEGLLMGPPAFESHLAEASCFIYVTGSERSWPEQDAARAVLDQFGQSHPSDAMWSALHALRERAVELRSWTSGAGERVYVYGLGVPDGGTRRSDNEDSSTRE